MDQADSTLKIISLELQCLYSLVGRWEEYSSLALSLLPVSLRRKLLLHLPVADLCRLEKDQVFMSDIDSDSIWLGLLNKRISLGPRIHQKSLKMHPSAKDVYFTEIVVNLITSKRCSIRYKFPKTLECQFKSNLFMYMVFGTPLESCDEELTLNLFIKQKSLGMTWLIPNHYGNILEEVTDSVPMALVKIFLNRFKWYPKTLVLTEDDVIDSNLYGKNRIYQRLMSQVETVHVENNDYSNYMYGDCLGSLWLALASSKPSSFSNVVLSGCVTNLGNTITNLVETLFPSDKKEEYDEDDDDDYDDDEEDSVDEVSVASEDEIDASPFQKFAGFKQIKLLGDDGGTGPHEHGYPGYLAHHIHEFIPFLAFQNELERLTIQGFENIVKTEDEQRYDECDSDYEGFNTFYNYFPHIISKQTFKSLHVKSCKLPLNAVKSMISIFLSCQTSHNQSLQIIDCDIVAECTDVYSSEFPLIEPTTMPCVCGDYKSLSISLNNSLLSLQWLFEYPNLHLRRLEVTCATYKGVVDMQSLELCPFSVIKEFCCTFYGVDDRLVDEDVAKVIQTVIKPPSLSELEFLKCHSSTADDGLLSVMTNVFSQPFQLSSLRRLKIQKLYINHTPVFGEKKIVPFFDALFRMPKDQLAEFTLELIDNKDLDYLQQEIFDAWKAKSGGQKLKKFINVIHSSYYCSESGPVYAPINELLSSIAIDSNVELVL